MGQRDTGGELGVLPAQGPVGERQEAGPGRLFTMLRGAVVSRNDGGPAQPEQGPALRGGPAEGEPERAARISGAVVAACVLVVLSVTAVSFLAFPDDSNTQAGPSVSVNPARTSAGESASEETPSGSPTATNTPKPTKSRPSQASGRSGNPTVPAGTASSRPRAEPGTTSSHAIEAAPGTTTAATAEPGPSSTGSPAAAGRMIVGFASSRCIEVTAHDGTDGSPLRLWSCGGDAWQKWVFRPDGSVRSMGLCMDLANATTANGSGIQLARCNGGWAQQFHLTGADDLVNRATGKCVDVTGAATGNGARLQLWDCAGTSNQKWRLR
ncbi:ricin-type beta-trefoil lectin domain protein [Streptomyces coerulescens]|uniref:Ricin-type beta-trefoil lectin domain protein n=1 Tax=Streptomyces coerulescens TaxID=29304 RepID=A0ABW0CXD3_STRCD